MPLALTRRPAATLANCELTFLDRAPIDSALAERQHAAYGAALEAAGCEVVTLPAVTEYPDSVFVEDVAVVLDEVALLTHPGAASRQGEVALIAEALNPYRPVVRLRDEFGADSASTLEGGDVLRVGHTLYVGRSARTNLAGHQALRAIVKPYGYTVVTVPVTGCLHLKTGVTALDDRTLLANPDWVDLTPFVGFDIIPVAADEPWAANVLRVGTTLLASSAYPRTLAKLEPRGFYARAVDISEFAKAEAGLTCLSLVFNELATTPI